MAPTYAHPHLVIRFGGHFGQAESIFDNWSTGLRLGHPAVATGYNATDLQDLVEAVSAALTTLHGNTSTGASTSCFLDWVTGARVGVNGKYDPATQETVRFDRTPFAGTGTAHLPFSTAMVCSLRTNFPRGYASNGRIYYPALSIALQDIYGTVDATKTLNRLNAFKTFLDAVNVAADAYETGTKVIVASGVAPGRQAYVTSIRMDGRLDAIERRENDQPAEYQTATLA